MSRPCKVNEEKYDHQLTAYVKESTYLNLVIFCKEMKFSNVGIAIRNVLELVDDESFRKSFLSLFYGLDSKKVSDGRK